MPWRSLKLRRFYVTGVALCVLPRGQIYAQASLGISFFCVVDVGQGTLPRGMTGVGQRILPRNLIYAPLILRRIIMCTAKELMYVLAPFGALPFLRDRYGIRCIAKGSDVYPGVPWGAAAFAWQV